MTQKGHSLILSTFFISLLISGVSYWFGFFDTWQEKIIDRFFITKEPPSEIIIVGIDDRSLSDIGQWPWRRSVFASILANLSLAESVGFDIEFAEKSRYGNADDNVFRKALSEAETRVILAIGKTLETEALPTTQFGDSAKIGYANVSKDSDGIVRKVQADRPLLGLSVLGDFDQPTIKNLRIDWYGREGTFPTISFSDVLSGDLEREFFSKKIILIGATAPGLKDFMETPFGSMPGVEVHANVTATAISGNFFKETPRWLDLIFILFLSALSSLAVFISKKLSRLLIYLLLIFVFLNLAVLISFSLYLILPVLYLNLAIFASSTFSISGQYVKERKEKEFVRHTFQHYLAPSVVAELVENPDKLSLGGEKKNLSIFFSDIRGFTSLSERLSAEELSIRLNEYLSVMTDIILDHKGLVDKFIGDAIMAFWGAPLDDDNHSENACLAAREMILSLNNLNRKWEREGKEPIAIGVGISSGEVVVGNMGSKDRFNYTIIGDEVNFTSRLEGLTKIYGVSILASESIFKKAKQNTTLSFREIDKVVVKGKKEPRRIFELLTGDIDKEKLDLFNKGREEYYLGNFKKAKEYLNRALEHGEDGPSRALLLRCQEFVKNPPALWDGVFRLTEK